MVDRRVSGSSGVSGSDDLRSLIDAAVERAEREMLEASETTRAFLTGSAAYYRDSGKALRELADKLEGKAEESGEALARVHAAAGQWRSATAEWTSRELAAFFGEVFRDGPNHEIPEEAAKVIERALRRKRTPQQKSVRRVWALLTRLHSHERKAHRAARNASWTREGGFADIHLAPEDPVLAAKAGWLRDGVGALLGEPATCGVWRSLTRTAADYIEQGERAGYWRLTSAGRDLYRRSRKADERKLVSRNADRLREHPPRLLLEDE
jgi:hypothetical protein